MDAQSDVVWVLLAVGLGMAALIALLAVVFTISMTRRPQTGLGPRIRQAAPTRLVDGVMPPPPPGGIEGSWNAMLAGGGLIGSMGGTLNARPGRLDLNAGVLSFTPEHLPEPDWAVPCTQLRIRRLDFLTPRGDLEINGPMGQLRFTVSREKINQFTRNGFKQMREHGYAREFVHAVLTNGAQHS